MKYALPDIVRCIHTLFTVESSIGHSLLYTLETLAKQLIKGYYEHPPVTYRIYKEWMRKKGYSDIADTVWFATILLNVFKQFARGVCEYKCKSVLIPHGFGDLVLLRDFVSNVVTKEVDNVKIVAKIARNYGEPIVLMLTFLSMSVGISPRELIEVYILHKYPVGRREIYRIMSKVVEHRYVTPYIVYKLMSPIIHQYHVEVHGKVPIAPYDIIAGSLRLAGKYSDDVIIGVDELIAEIKEWWKETRYSEEISGLELDIETFTHSLAHITYSGIDGIHITTMQKPVYKLPPRNIGFDSIFLRPGRLHIIVHKYSYK